MPNIQPGCVYRLTNGRTVTCLTRDLEYISPIDNLRLMVFYDSYGMCFADEEGYFHPDSEVVEEVLPDGNALPIPKTPEKTLIGDFIKGTIRYSSSRVGIVLLLFLGANSHAGSLPSQEQLEAEFSRAAHTYDVSEHALRAVCWVESRFKVSTPDIKDGNTRSHGICQLKLIAAKDVGFTGKAYELDAPYLNIAYAAKYLSKQMRACGSWQAGIQAYNSGHCGSKNVDYLRAVMQAMTEGR